MRNRTGPLRPKVLSDENATGRHARQASISAHGVTRASSSLANVAALKHGIARSALGEVTTTAINRKVRFPSASATVYCAAVGSTKHGISVLTVPSQENGSKLTGKDKEVIEPGLKRSRSSSLAAAQRVPLGPGKAPTAQISAPVVVPPRVTTVRGVQRPIVPLRPTQQIALPQEPVVVLDDAAPADEMDVEDVKMAEPIVVEPEHSAEQVEAMVDGADDEYYDEMEQPLEPRAPRIWPELGTERAQRFQSELDRIRENFNDVVDIDDTTMVCEYAEEIFEYMHELEVRALVSVCFAVC